MAGYGQRERVVFRNFSGVDPRRSGLFPESFVPQEMVERGLLLDATNCRFSRGRAYWHRNQVRLVMPPGVCTASTFCAIESAVRLTNVVTCTTDQDHALVAGNVVYITGSGAFGIDGTWTVASVPGTDSFTFAQTGSDASSGPLVGCVCQPDRLLLALPFVTGEYDQLLVFSELGSAYFTDVDWSATPTQWTYGYSLFDALSWSSISSLPLGWYDPDTSAEAVVTDWVPLSGVMGFAQMSNVLFLCAGVDTNWTYGMTTAYWNGAQLLPVGFQTPSSALAATADATGAGNALVEGRYSYRVVVGDDHADSMPGPIADVEVEYAAATAYVEPKTSTTPPSHLDTLTVDGIVYRFVDLNTVLAGGFTVRPYDITCGWSVDAATDAKVTYRVLQSAIKEGRTDSYSGTAAYTPAHPTVTAEWEYATAGVTRVTLTARETGTGGNSIALAESTSDARIHISAAALAGGKAECHIDLSSIPVDPITRVNHRRLYRAYTSSLDPGVRGSEYRYLCTIADNTTTSYVDNTPQDELGEAIAFDHAMPPSGSILCHHRDRLWMAGVCATSDSYRESRNVAASPGGAVRSSNVVTITTTIAHNLQVGDWVFVDLPSPSTFDGAFQVASVPSSTSFTYAQVAANATHGGGYVRYGVELSGLGNVLFYSELGTPWYWPTENRISVGSSAPIVALASWHDQLVVIKEDSAYLLTGYGESDWQLTPIPGATGAVGSHVAVSPHGIMWSGHSGWELFDGSFVRKILDYHRFASWAYEIEDAAAPLESSFTASNIPYPMICFHAGRFYIMDGTRDYCLCWLPAEDAWEIRRLRMRRSGLRAWNFGPDHSHILALLTWDPVSGAVGSQYLTMVDSLYLPDVIPQGNYGDSAGTSAGTYYGAVRVELPPIVAEPGEAVRPLDVWVSGQWDKPADSDEDLHLYVSTGANAAWTDLGAVTQNKRIGIPAGYACPRLRLLLQGVNTPHFALQAVTVEYQRRTARGA